MTMGRFNGLLAALLVSVPHMSQAQPAAGEGAFPSRPLRIIVPFHPGGTPDVQIRLMQERLAQRLGQPVVIDNRGGANGIIGMEIAARAAPDGYTVTYATVGAWTVHPFLIKLPYDVLKDFTAVIHTAVTPGVLVVHPSVQAKTVKELIALAKEKPGQLSYGSAGIGNTIHLASAMLNARAGTDMPVRSWVDRLPRALVPYAQLMRLDRPIGTWLLLFPGLWSIALALRGPSDLRFFVWFAVGALLMRGAGCVWNDITDRDFDKAVARTRTRPLAAGTVSVTEAFAFLGFLLFLALLILLQFNIFAAVLGAGSLVIVAVYPLMKRITHWPQAVLGLAFNWGALLGWAAVRGELSWAPALLYIGGIFWTLGYDTIYADRKSTRLNSSH